MKRDENNRVNLLVEHNSFQDAELSDAAIRNIKTQSKYRKEYAELLREHMKENSFPSFAAVVGVHDSTLYFWKKIYPEFASACAESREPKRKLYG